MNQKIGLRVGLAVRVTMPLDTFPSLLPCETLVRDACNTAGGRQSKKSRTSQRHSKYGRRCHRLSFLLRHSDVLGFLLGWDQLPYQSRSELGLDTGIDRRFPLPLKDETSADIGQLLISCERLWPKISCSD